MKNIKNLLPGFAIVATLMLFLNQNNREHPLTALFFVLISSLVVGWILSALYFFVCSKFYNKENIFAIEFKHAFFVAMILMSINFMSDAPTKSNQEIQQDDLNRSTNQETGDWESHKNDARSYDCPHCNGTGNRMNEVTANYGKCGSCKGTGKVTKWELEHYSNSNSNSNAPTPSNNEANYNCPRCGGTGAETNMSGDGMGQTTCSLCQGNGKVDQWTYDNFDK